MLRYAVRRMAASLLLILASSVLVFVLVTSAGDPVAPLALDPDVSAEQVAERRRELHLDEPVVSRYLRWAGGLVRGDMGESLEGRPVRTLLWERLQVTLRMVVAALVFALAGAVLVGAWSARHPYSWRDSAITVGCLVVLSLPVFWLGGLLKEFAAVRLNQLLGRRVIATLGESDPNLTGDLLGRVGNYASHLVLPTLALAAILVAAWSRYLRAAMIEVLARDHIRAARARGIPEWRLTVRHALRNALGPFTALAAVDFAQVLGGVVVLEQVFGWHGMGDMLVKGVLGPDVNVVLAWLMVTASLVVVANLVADLALARIDPRVRLG